MQFTVWLLCGHINACLQKKGEYRERRVLIRNNADPIFYDAREESLGFYVMVKLSVLRLVGRVLQSWRPTPCKCLW